MRTLGEEKSFVLPSRNQMSNMQNSWVLHIHDSQLSSSPGPLSLSWMSLQVKKKKTISAAAAVNLVVLVDWTQKLQTSNTLDI